MIARRQDNGCWRSDGLARNRQVHKRPPEGLGEEAPEVHLHLRQCLKGIQVDLLSSWRTPVYNAGDVGGEVPNLVYNTV